MSSKKYWERKHAKYASQNWINNPTIFVKQVVKHFPEKGKILELAAGQGQDSRFFAYKGFNVLSSDFSEFALEESKKKTPKPLLKKIDFKLVDLNKKLPFKPKSFDIVYCHLGLHYFSNKRTKQIFSEIYKILKSGGIFATLTNTTDDPDYKIGKEIEKDYYENEGFKKRYFDLPYMKELTRKFRVITLDNRGSTHKDAIKTLIRFVGTKPK